MLIVTLHTERAAEPEEIEKALTDTLTTVRQLVETGLALAQLENASG